MNNIKIGDEVTTDGHSGFCDRSKTKIKDIIKRYDTETGAPYQVFITESGQEFDGRDGMAITCPTAYYIEELLK